MSSCLALFPSDWYHDILWFILSLLTISLPCRPSRTTELTAVNFGLKKLDTQLYISIHWTVEAWITSVTDRLTDGRTDRQTDRIAVLKAVEMGRFGVVTYRQRLRHRHADDWTCCRWSVWSIVSPDECLYMHVGRRQTSVNKQYITIQYIHSYQTRSTLKHT